MDFGVCDKSALIVLGATFSRGFFFFFSVSHKSKSDPIRMKPPVPHRQISETPANAGCNNQPAGVSLSPPTDDAICLLASTTATAEPDSYTAVEDENCACGTLGRLGRFCRPKAKQRKTLQNKRRGFSTHLSGTK